MSLINALALQSHVSQLQKRAAAMPAVFSVHLLRQSTPKI